MNAVSTQVAQSSPARGPDAIAASALSAQELAIEQGHKALHGSISERVLRLFDAIRAYGSPRVTLDRAVCFTESFEATEGQPLVLRWAKALKHVAENIPVTIFDRRAPGGPARYLARPLRPRLRRTRRQPAQGGGRRLPRSSRDKRARS